MSWNELQPPAPKATAPVKFSTGKRGGANVAFKGWLSFTKEGLEQFDLKPGMTFRVLVGHGEVRGKVKIIQDEAGGFTLRLRMHGSAVIDLGPMAGLVQKRFMPEGVACERDEDGALEVTLPAWAFPDTKPEPTRISPK